jgi:BspA type Leucine rich repeat region (6 copies)
MKIRIQILFLALLAVALPTLVHAQFSYTDNGDGTCTITGYTGSGGALTITNSINGLTVVSIGDSAFYSANLTSVSIPDSVTNIGNYAFQYCFSLTSATLGNSVASLGEGAFEYCEALTNIIIPDSVFAIGENAFFESGLTSVTLGNSVNSIGQSAFSATDLTSILIPNSVTNIAFEAFASCRNLTNIMVDAANPAYTSSNGVLFDKDQTTLIAFPGGIAGSYVIPDSVTNIETGAFQTSYLTNITIPNSVIWIGDNAFSSCLDLKSIIIPSSVNNIGDGAFAYCSYLKSVFFEGNAPPDDGTIFYDDPATVYYSYGTTGWGSTFGSVPTSLYSSGFGYSINGGTVTLTRYLGTDTVVTVPDSINNLPVTSIGSGTFSGLGLSSVIIPDSVTSIGGVAFSSCYNLTNIMIPDSVTNIGSYAFQFCSHLASIIIPDSVTSIGTYAFNGCSNLVSVAIGNGVSSIGINAFIHCGLTNVTLPNSITSIGSGAFAYCKMTSLIIPDSVTSIGSGAFSYCYNLTNASIGNGVISIGVGAFGVCSNLICVTIGSGVQSIGSGAFGTCPALEFVYFKGNAPPINANAFIPSPATIYYLPGTKGWGSTLGGRPAALWNPQAVAAGVSGGHFGFNITGPTNATIVVEASASLSNLVWLPVSTNTLSASGTSSFSDPQFSNYSSRYYRFASP